MKRLIFVILAVGLVLGLIGCSEPEATVPPATTMPPVATTTAGCVHQYTDADCTKAKTELGYTTRSYEETIHDEVQWMIAEGLIDGNGVTEKPTLMTNEQIREGGYMEDIVKAIEHDMTDVDVEKAYKAIEEGVVSTYEKVEDTVVGGYKAIEQGAVSGFRKISDVFIRKFFSRKGESVEETRKRLSRK